MRSGLVVVNRVSGSSRGRSGMTFGLLSHADEAEVLEASIKTVEVEARIVRKLHDIRRKEADHQ